MDDGTANLGGNPDLHSALVEYALGNWCASPMVVPDPDPATPLDCPWTKVELRFEISDFAMRALYQLHFLWCRDRGEQLNSLAWARHYSSLLLNGALVPVVAVIGGLPVGAIEVTMFNDPFTGQFCIQPDKAYVLKEFRHKGVFDRIMGQVKAIGDLFSGEKFIVPASPAMSETYRKAIIREGLEPEVASIILVTENN